mmetsp:Transcript_3046/g.10359  ORF Transcript_3046/g.10359 Transcript_3046/m.10359 type:complete len:204 (-) Transcript_3046:2-613(-)
MRSFVTPVVRYVRASSSPIISMASFLTLSTAADSFSRRSLSESDDVSGSGGWPSICAFCSSLSMLSGTPDQFAYSFRKVAMHRHLSSMARDLREDLCDAVQPRRDRSGWSILERGHLRLERSDHRVPELQLELGGLRGEPLVQLGGLRGELLVQLDGLRGELVLDHLGQGDLERIQRGGERVGGAGRGGGRGRLLHDGDPDGG